MSDGWDDNRKRWLDELDCREEWARQVCSQIVELVGKYDARPRFTEMVAKWDTGCRKRIKSGKPIAILFTGGHQRQRDGLPIGLPEMYASLAAFYDGTCHSGNPLAPVEFDFRDTWGGIADGSGTALKKGEPIHLRVLKPEHLRPTAGGAIQEMLRVVEKDLSQWSDEGEPFYKPAYFGQWNIGDELLRRNSIESKEYVEGKVRRQRQVPSNASRKTPAKGKQGKSRGKAKPVYWYSEPDARKRYPEKFASGESEPTTS